MSSRSNIWISFQLTLFCKGRCQWKTHFFLFPAWFSWGRLCKFMTPALVFSLIIAFSANLFTAQKCPIGQIYHLANWIKQTRKTVRHQSKTGQKYATHCVATFFKEERFGLLEIWKSFSFGSEMFKIKNGPEYGLMKMG